MDRIGKFKIPVPALAAAIICCLAGCSGGNRAPEAIPENAVYIRASQETSSEPLSRTYIGGEALDRTFWSELDKIGVYWRPAGSDEALSGHTFSCYRIYADEALFSATIPEMEPGEYCYYGVYPSSATVNGTSVSYTLPAVQDGTYEMQRIAIREADTHSSYSGNCDFMIAAPATGGALLSESGGPTLKFYHQCHVMRIQVPTGRNRWGANVTRLRVQFPSSVVGTITADMTNPLAAPILTGGTSTVWVNLREPFAESEEDDPDGKYVWLFLCPGMIEGDVTFTAYDENGYQSRSISVAMNKTLAAGKITPVNLTIPEELPLTWIDFSITANNLGEDPDRIMVRAPEGGRFRNGTDTCSFAANAHNRYSLAFYHEYDGLDNGAVLRNGDFTFTYDSPNALVSESRSIGDFTPQERTAVALTVPYLFYEDFSGAGGTDWNGSTVDLESYGLGGWSGSRFGLQANTAAMISAYLGSSAVMPEPDKGDNKRGRIDTPPLAGLKDGTAVTLEVSFDIGGTMEKGTNFFGQASMYSRYEFGIDTRTGPVEYTQGLESVAIPEEDAGTDGNYTNLPLHKSGIEVAGCTNRHRLVWRTSYRIEYAGASTITGKTVYVYIDNIKVSIKK